MGSERGLDQGTSWASGCPQPSIKFLNNPNSGSLHASRHGLVLGAPQARIWASCEPRTRGHGNPTRAWLWAPTWPQVSLLEGPTIGPIQACSSRALTGILIGRATLAAHTNHTPLAPTSSEGGCAAEGASSSLESPPAREAATEAVDATEPPPVEAPTSLSCTHERPASCVAG